MISGAALKGLAVGLAAALALVPTTLGALDRLRTARTAESRLAETLAAVPAAPPGLERAVSLLRAEAARGGVLVEQLAAADGVVRLRLSGLENAVIALADRVERRHGLRFTRWALGSDGAAVRLEAEAVPYAGGAAPPPLASVHQRTLFGTDGERMVADAPELIGVAGRIGQDAVAMVRGDDGPTRTLAIGEGVDGWTLESLAIDAAYFTRGGQRARVPLPAGE